MSEYDRWETRYAVPEYAFGKEPNYFLVSCKFLLPRKGRALAVADGEGRNGVWLAEQGLDVTFDRLLALGAKQSSGARGRTRRQHRLRAR